MLTIPFKNLYVFDKPIHLSLFFYLILGLDGPKVMNKTSKPLSQSMTLCLVAGARLRNHVIQITSEENVKSCVKQCLQHPHCMSLNYIKSEEICELNDVVSLDWISPSDFLNMLENEEFNHYTPQVECGK